MGPTRAVCRGGVCEATHEAADGGPTFVVGDRRCLPALACNAWAGCALVEGNVQDGYFVVDATSAPRGTLASVEADACTPRAGVPKPSVRCAAARLFVKGVTCPPTSVPPLIAPPKPCVLDGLRCH